MIPSQAEKYLASRGADGPWKLQGDAGTGFEGAIIIPSLAESGHLLATLTSLASNPPDSLSRILILVVVNNRDDAPLADKIDNLTTLESLPVWAKQLPSLRLAWIDAAAPGKELPAKGGGVGLGRKLGHDLALPLLSWEADPFLASLDADTLVDSSYLTALVRHFNEHREGGAVLDFCHQTAEGTAEQTAIDRYELFLRCYVLGLQLADSPYAFHTVGSAMACRATAYVSSGGMNSRVAGEDFYFLQQLKKTSGIAQVNGTTVYPSARASHRVPFGTGRSIGRLLAGDDGGVLSYHPECYRLLGAWLSLVAANLDRDSAQLQSQAGQISSGLADYLESIAFEEAWGKLRKNNRTDKALQAGFHGWFDALKTMKLIHHLSAGDHPRGDEENAVKELFRLAGLHPLDGQKLQLDVLRKLQAGKRK